MITTEELDSLLVLLQAHAGAPGCWYETITKDRARELIAALTREPAPAVIDALNEPMIGDRNVVATHRVAVPAPCPHRELLRASRGIAQAIVDGYAVNIAVARYHVADIDAALASAQPCATPVGCQHRERLREAFDALPRECCKTDPDLLDRIEATLKQPCAAPGEAGDGFEFEQHITITSDLPRGLLIGAPDFKAGDQVRVYRRRAPQPQAAPQRSSEPPDPCATCGHDAMGHEGPWEREPPHRGQCCKKGCPCAVYRRAPEREGGAR